MHEKHIGINAHQQIIVLCAVVLKQNYELRNLCMNGNDTTFARCCATERRSHSHSGTGGLWQGMLAWGVTVDRTGGGDISTF